MPVGTALATTAISAGGSMYASHQASKAAGKAANTQLAMYNQTRQDLMPFASAGTGALSQLASIFGFGPGGTGMPNAAAATSQLTQFPGYQFGLDQGVQALDRSAASRGMLLSGAQLQDAQKFGQGYAMQQAWQPYVSGLQWAAGLGENAAAQTGNLGANAAQGAAQSQLAQGSAQANGIAGATNSLQSGLQQYLINQGGGASSPMAVPRFGPEMAMYKGVRFGGDWGLPASNPSFTSSGLEGYGGDWGLPPAGGGGFTTRGVGALGIEGI